MHRAAGFLTWAGQNHPINRQCPKGTGTAPPLTQRVCAGPAQGRTRFKGLDVSETIFRCRSWHHRVHMMKDQLPHTRYDTGLLPLRDTAFAQACDTQYGSASAHFFADMFSVHAMSIDSSKRKEKKYLNLCLVFSCFNGDMDIYSIRRRNLQRLIEDRAHGNAADFARSIGRTRAQVAQYLSSSYNGGRSIGERVARAIEKEVGLDAHSLDQQGYGYGFGNKQAFDANVQDARMGERRIPLLNYVQAGVFRDPGQNFTFEEVEYLLTDLCLSERSFALQIKGDSMLPDFKEGDRIIVDCELTPRPGDYVVAKNSEEEATFKKYRLLCIDEEGQEIFELVPLNEDYPSIRSDQHAIQIIGTMVEHRKYYRRA